MLHTSSFYGRFASLASLDERDFNPARSHFVELDAGQEQHAGCLKGEMHQWERKEGGLLKKHGMEREQNHCSIQMSVRKRILNLQEAKQPKLQKLERDCGLKLLQDRINSPPAPLVSLSLLISPPLV